MSDNLLDNELVRTYFGCRALCTEAHFVNVGYDEHERCIAYRILDAMQQPIRKGERYLDINGLSCGAGVKEGVSLLDIYYLHAFYLRLPNAFQPQNQKQENPQCQPMCCAICGGTVVHKPTPSPEKCEASIKCCAGCWKYPEKHDCPCHKPKDAAVEEKIEKMAKQFMPRLFGFETELRDLVRIARETK